MAAIQPALDGTIPPKADNYETWAEQARPTYVAEARTGRRFLFWKVARDHNIPQPPDPAHDWGRFAAELHRDGITRLDGFGFTPDKSSVRAWRGTQAAIEGRSA